MTDGNGWPEWRMHVRETMERLEARMERLSERIVAQETGAAWARVWSGIWGAIGGAITTIGAIVAASAMRGH